MNLDIRAALTKPFENENGRIDYLVDVLQKAALAGTEFYMPNESDDPQEVVCTQVQLSNGMICMPVFTSIERLACTIDAKAFATNLENMALSLLISEGCDGIVIDIGRDSIILTHSLMQRIMEPVWVEETFEESDTIRLNKAIHFATEMHAGSFRKGSTTPYICHPMEVMELLNEMNGDTNLMIAGLLHDVVEDTDATIRQVAGMFGVDVAALVAGHSENKSWSWEDRKRQCIIDTAGSGMREQMLVMADTISNQRSMLKDYRQHGDHFWGKFKRGKDQQCWYYSGKQDALWPMQFDPNTKPLYWQMVNDFKDIFVKYWLDVENHLIWGGGSDKRIFENQMNQTNQTNQMNQTNQTNQMNQTNCSCNRFF